MSPKLPLADMSVSEPRNDGILWIISILAATDGEAFR
jgi:hypothetical protein